MWTLSEKELVGKRRTRVRRARSIGAACLGITGEMSVAESTPETDWVGEAGGPGVRTGSFMPGRLEWLASLQANGKSAITILSYDRDLGDVAAAVGGDCASHNRIAQFDQAIIDAVAVRWEMAGISRSTVLRRFSALRSFAAYLCAHGVSCTRVLAARLPHPIRKPRVGLHEDDLDALSAPVSEPRDMIKVRNRSIVVLQAEAGLTTGEIVGLDLADLDLEERTISIVRTHLEPRVLRISPQALAPLSAYVTEFRGDAPGALFLSRRDSRLGARSIQLLFRSLCRRSGVREDADPSSIRHAMGFAFVDSGITLPVLADALGLTLGSALRYFRAGDRKP
jgi:integrase/recombinase XerC